MATSKSCAPASARAKNLYEELLIDAYSQPTSHPLIYRAEEQAIAPEMLWPQIDALEAAIQRHDEVQH